MVEEFRASYEEKLWMRLYREKGNGKYQLNLWEACSRQNLLRAGVLPGSDRGDRFVYLLQPSDIFLASCFRRESAETLPDF